MSKRLYERSSQTISVRDIRPDVLDVIEAHATARMLGSVASTATECVQTRSVSLKRPGLLARLGGATTEPEHQTVAVLTPTTLIVATVGEQRGITVLSTRLADVDGIEQMNPAPVVDSSVHVQARWGSAEASSYIVALGDDQAARAFLAALRSAVTATKQAR
ncbi:hypothetical protein [Phytohabitans rumicis]|uniref:Uncharacterized protein n=1 Tax=Phytohabitans rumicis TaxID=1076125 RepID=A0A6V8LG63_9ACTN|nr:hypothetical protein [Phytohabitans rumicis]GFJ93868.1 hypothetical protein Prum_075100 [Phytohabitans rumicis]